MGYRLEEKTGTDRRAGEVSRILWVILGLNLAVAAGKLFYGVMIGSVSMQADGFHSTFDGASNVVGLVGMAFAARPADNQHPYGHGKYETYASAVIGGMLLLAAWEIGSQAVGKLINGGTPPVVNAGAFAVMGITLVINILVSWYEGKKGHELRSDLLIADASHTGSDVLVSVGVLLGLGLVMLGFPLADPIIALLVSGAIVYTAWGVFKSANEVLSDTATLAVQRVREVALAVKGVLGCHGVRTRGPASHTMVDLHIQVNPNDTVAQGHAIAEEVERKLCDSIPGVVDVIVHLEPMDDYQNHKTLSELSAEE